MDNTEAIHRIRNRLKELESERNELEIALKVLNRLTEVEDANLVFPNVEIDFTGADNLRERLVRIAEAVPGPLESRDLAQCLIQRGLSNAQLRNLQSYIINQLRDDPDFVKLGASRYEYRPDQGTIDQEVE